MSWLFVPGLECSQKASELHASFLDSNTVLSVTSKGKSLQPRSLSRLWKQGSSIRRLSGLTCSPSRASSGVKEWIASLGDFHASRGQPRASKQEQLTNAGSGPTLYESFAKVNRHFASLKTCGDLFQAADSNSSLLDLPISGSMRNGVLSPQPMLALTTSGSVSLSWPTARDNDSEKRGEIADDPRNGLVSASLHWMTPKAHDGDFGTPMTSGRPIEKSTHLATQAKIWATPNAHDGRRPGADLKSTQGANLSRDAVLWPTPVASDCGAKVTENNHQPGLILAAFAFSRQGPPLPSGNGSSKHRLGLRPRLNPMFVCWLMGWPIWWTNPGLTSSARPAMASYRSLLQSHLSSLLDAQELFRDAA